MLYVRVRWVRLAVSGRCVRGVFDVGRVCQFLIVNRVGDSVCSRAESNFRVLVVILPSALYGPNQ